LLAIALPAAAAVISGCATSPQSIVQDESEHPTAQHSIALSEELSNLWASPDVAQLSMGSAETGPSLIAGDWLAFQCAAAGGYFDMTPQTFAAMIEQD
jgi:uncharacterized protein YceK